MIHEPNCDIVTALGTSRAREQVKAPRTLQGVGAFVAFGGAMTDPAEARLTRELAAHAANVTPSAVAMWASRGWVDPATGQRRKLEPVERDWRGRPLYRYGDVMAAEQATRRRGRRRDWAALNTKPVGLMQAS